MTTVQTTTNGHVREHQRKMEKSRLVCPHIGVQNDPETWLAFPAPGNCCHYAKPIGLVKLEHQQQFCLNENHAQCPMLRQKAGSVLLTEIQLPMTRPAMIRFWPALLLVMVGLVITGWLLLNGDRRTPQTLAVAPAGTLIPLAVLPTQTLTPTNTIPPSSTSTPSPTPVPDTPTPQNTVTLRPTDTTVPSLTPIPPTASPVPPQIIVTVERLNVREGPGIAYPSVGIINLGERANIIGLNRNGDWWQVCCINGLSGWVFGGSVSVDGDTSAVPIVLNIPPLPTTTSEATAAPTP